MSTRRGRGASIRSDRSRLHCQRSNGRLLYNHLRGNATRSAGSFSDSSSLRGCFISAEVTKHNSTFCSRSRDEWGWWSSGAEGAGELPPSSLWEQPICQRHYGALISWLAPVYAGWDFWSWGEALGIPHSRRMIDRAAARRKGSCDERERKKCVPMSPLCF